MVVSDRLAAEKHTQQHSSTKLAPLLSPQCQWIYAAINICIGNRCARQLKGRAWMPRSKLILLPVFTQWMQQSRVGVYSALPFPRALNLFHSFSTSCGFGSLSRLLRIYHCGRRCVLFRSPISWTCAHH